MWLKPTFSIWRLSIPGHNCSAPARNAALGGSSLTRCLFEVPSNINATAASMAIAGSGAVKDIKTSILMAPDDGFDAMLLAQGAGYRPPGAWDRSGLPTNAPARFVACVRGEGLLKLHPARGPRPYGTAIATVENPRLVEQTSRLILITGRGRPCSRRVTDQRLLHRDRHRCPRTWAIWSSGRAAVAEADGWNCGDMLHSIRLRRPSTHWLDDRNVSRSRRRSTCPSSWLYQLCRPARAERSLAGVCSMRLRRQAACSIGSGHSGIVTRPPMSASWAPSGSRRISWRVCPFEDPWPETRARGVPTHACVAADLVAGRLGIGRRVWLRGRPGIRQAARRTLDSQDALWRPWAYWPAPVGPAADADERGARPPWQPGQGDQGYRRAGGVTVHLLRVPQAMNSTVSSRSK